MRPLVAGDANHKRDWLRLLRGGFETAALTIWATLPPSWECHSLLREMKERNGLWTDRLCHGHVSAWSDADAPARQRDMRLQGRMHGVAFWSPIVQVTLLERTRRFADHDRALLTDSQWTTQATGNHDVSTRADASSGLTASVCLHSLLSGALNATSRLAGIELTV
jgi:hypothetical protein